MDAVKRTISSKNKIESNGPMGQISGKGFFYDVNKEEFKIKLEISLIFLIFTITIIIVNSERAYFY